MWAVLVRFNVCSLDKHGSCFQRNRYDSERMNAALLEMFSHISPPPPPSRPRPCPYPAGGLLGMGCRFWHSSQVTWEHTAKGPSERFLTELYNRKGLQRLQSNLGDPEGCHDSSSFFQGIHGRAWPKPVLPETGPARTHPVAKASSWKTWANLLEHIYFQIILISSA